MWARTQNMVGAFDFNLNWQRISAVLSMVLSDSPSNLASPTKKWPSLNKYLILLISFYLKVVVNTIQSISVGILFFLVYCWIMLFCKSWITVLLYRLIDKALDTFGIYYRQCFCTFSLIVSSSSVLLNHCLVYMYNK